MVTVLATAGMTVASLVLYTISALAPFITDEWGLSRAAVGALASIMFGVASVASLMAGPAVDVVGIRRAFFALSGVMVVAMSLAFTAQSYWWLVAAAAVAGLGLALVNPATNQLIAAGVPAQRHGTAIGFKQSGGQFAALGGGLGLPVVAAAAGWRAGFGLAALLTVALLIAVWWLVPGGGVAKGSGLRWQRPEVWLTGLMGYALLLSVSMAAVGTYVPLYAVEDLGLPSWFGGAALAVFGVAGIAGRVWWGRWADRAPRVRGALVGLALVAAVSVLTLLAAAVVSPALVWLAVVRRGGTGYASAMVSIGIFMGFVVGPAGFGLIADAAGYALAWSVVALGAVTSAGLLVLLRRQVTV